MVDPIKPSDIMRAKRSSLPDGVFEAFNEIIVEKWDGNYESYFLQSTIVKRLKEKFPDLSDDDFFKKGYLNVEEFYIEAGWKVVYDSPDYNETYPPSFKFIKKR